MKHESFYKAYAEIAVKEQRELRKCLEKLGGSFTWKDSGIEYPIITASIDDCEYVGDVDVMKIWVESKGNIRMSVNLHDGSVSDIEIGLGDVHYSHIDFIMDYLPEIEVKGEDEVRTYTYKEMENAVHLAADLAEDLAKIEKNGSYPWLDSRDKAAYFIKKAVEFEKRLGGKDEDEGNYDYIEELEKFEKEVMNEIIEDIPLPF